MIGLPSSNIPTHVHILQPLHPYPQIHVQLHLHPLPPPNPQQPQTSQPHIVLPPISENQHEYLEFSPLSSIQSLANEHQSQPVYRILNSIIVQPQTNIPLPL